VIRITFSGQSSQLRYPYTVHRGNCENQVSVMPVLTV